MMPDLEHAISAASLVLAVLAALYTLWLGEVGRVLAITPDADSDNRSPQKKEVAWTFWTKGVVLFLASGSAVAILASRAGGIVSEAILHWNDWAFDDVKALFVLTTALLVVVWIIAGAQALRLFRKLGEF